MSWLKDQNQMRAAVLGRVLNGHRPRAESHESSKLGDSPAWARKEGMAFEGCWPPRWRRLGGLAQRIQGLGRPSPAEPSAGVGMGSGMKLWLLLERSSFAWDGRISPRLALRIGAGVLEFFLFPFLYFLFQRRSRNGLGPLGPLGRFDLLAVSRDRLVLHQLVQEAVVQAVSPLHAGAGSNSAELCTFSQASASGGKASRKFKPERRSQKRDVDRLARPLGMRLARRNEGRQTHGGLRSLKHAQRQRLLHVDAVGPLYAISARKGIVRAAPPDPGAV